MTWQPLKKLLVDLESGKLKSVDLVNISLKAINDNQDFNAVIKVNPEAIKLAEEIDSQRAEGKKLGRLAGIPYAVKDNYLTEGLETTAASNILKGFVPPYSSTAINLLEDEGAIVVAKTNLDSFAHGSSTENSDFGVTLNPHDKTRVPGGSSGGSAAVVALEIVPFALGSDTGGSIRLPASFTGTVGYKPTYGLVSRYGVVAMASSTDVMGPIANNVQDAALVLDIISGKDRNDSTTIGRDKRHYDEIKGSMKDVKVGVLKEYMADGLQTEVKLAVDDAAKNLENHGALVSEISMPDIDKALAVYYVIMPAEVSSNLSRYDGIRYGHSSQSAKNIDEAYTLSRTEGFNEEVKRRIITGTFVLSSGYYDAYYKKAQAVRTKLINEFNQAFSEVDFILGPTSPTTAFKIGEKLDNPLSMYLADIMTVAANLVGIPAISLPAGLDNNKLPIGVQLMADQGKDYELLAISDLLEDAMS